MEKGQQGQMYGFISAIKSTMKEEECKEFDDRMRRAASLTCKDRKGR